LQAQHILSKQGQRTGLGNDSQLRSDFSGFDCLLATLTRPSYFKKRSLNVAIELRRQASTQMMLGHAIHKWRGPPRHYSITLNESMI
jgi:hypothetical protein